MNTNHLFSIHAITITVAGDLCKTSTHKPVFLQHAAVWGKDPAGIALFHAPNTLDSKTPSVQCLQQLD